MSIPYPHDDVEREGKTPRSRRLYLLSFIFIFFYIYIFEKRGFNLHPVKLHPLIDDQYRRYGVGGGPT